MSASGFLYTALFSDEMLVLEGLVTLIYLLLFLFRGK